MEGILKFFASAVGIIFLIGPIIAGVTPGDRRADGTKRPSIGRSQ